MAVYFDTGALAKRYVAEPGSDELDDFVATQSEPCLITPLVGLEFESVLQRLTRQRAIDARYAMRARRRLCRRPASGAVAYAAIRRRSADTRRRAAA